MNKIRIYELSKDLDVGSKDMVDFLNKFGIVQKNHMSTLEENELDLIFEHYTQMFAVESIDMYQKKVEEMMASPE